VALAGTEINVPAGTVTPLENVNGRNAERLTATAKKRRVNQYLVLETLERNLTNER
jgi:hypothetical protein